jgi:3-hydroxy-9,10-secoandrosta-1,3,5(10)-triene-9,17-dione monooxygenase
VDTAGHKQPIRDFSDVTYDEAMRRARELIPFLREQAPKNEELRRLTPETMDALHRNGLLRYFQPKAWGGMELPFIAYFDIPEMLGRGDAATAWVVANLASHHRNVALFDPKAQQEVWGENRDIGIASGIAFAQGRAIEVEGGLKCSGQWSFSSGTDHSEWNQLAFTLREGDKPVDWVYCLVHCSQYEVVDDWHVLGMRATSSKTIRCNDIFVPSHRVISMQWRKPGHTWPGLETHCNPMYRIPLSAVGGNGLTGCLVGNARHAVEFMVDYVKTRSTSYTGAKMRDFQTVQLRISEASAKIDAAAVFVRNDCAEVARIYDEGGYLETEARLRYKRNSAIAVKLVIEAIDSIFEMAGGNGIYDSDLQRMYRDAHAGAGHFSFSTDAQLPPWGLVTLGGEFKSPTL